jgi:hypothetical protein
MFISDRLIFLQLQKTGCTHIANLLTQYIPEGKMVGKHNPLSADFQKGTRYIVGSIRNPWDWYVSLWAFGCNGGKGGFYSGFYKRVTSRNIINAFRHRRYPYHALLNLCYEIRKPIKTWRRLYSNQESPTLFREWLSFVFDRRRRYDFGEQYGYSSISTFAGVLTYRYVRLFSGNLSRIYTDPSLNSIHQLRQFDEKYTVLDAVIRNEFLEEDLISVLRKAGYRLSEEQTTLIRSTQKTNISQHHPTGYYYDQETLELVMRKEQFIIEKYSYAPPQLLNDIAHR